MSSDNDDENKYTDSWRDIELGPRLD